MTGKTLLGQIDSGIYSMLLCGKRLKLTVKSHQFYIDVKYDV